MPGWEKRRRNTYHSHTLFQWQETEEKIPSFLTLQI